ncbi:MAG TPA: arylamine N-acetyltransferase [Bryobacteraceae bacterium]|nr:arylamine N-acetyltransferase [Bryobacteraceae bacterium]
MHVGAYLERIGHRGSVSATLETLRELHREHMLAVPFENLDIHLGRRIVLDPAALFEKIVTRRRGGFCYELNSMFAWLLSELGYSVTLLSAAVARAAGGGFGPDLDHLTLRVDLATPWLADVGFGESFREPLRMDDPGEQLQDGCVYRIRDQVLERKEDDGGWKPQYRFSLEPRSLADFGPMCHHNQTSPSSFFTQVRLCTRATPEGRLTLRDLRLTIAEGGRRVEHPLASEEEFRSVLLDRFGIRYDG